MTETLQAPVRTNEPPFVTFLREFGESLVAQTKVDNITGQVFHRLDTVDGGRTVLIVHFIDDEGYAPPAYSIRIVKRYFEQNMLEITSHDTNKPIYVQADARTVLALISF